MTTKIVLIHGRAQASDAQTAADPARLALYVDNKKRQFLAGLAKGLVLANCPPIAETDAIFPFYGNAFQKAIAGYENGGGTPPHLEAADPGIALEKSRGGDEGDIRALSTLQAEMLKDMAQRLNFRAGRESTYQGDEGFHPSEALGIPFVNGALQFLSRKTGVPAAIIRSHLTDVAYYIGMKTMRDSVLKVVRDAIEENAEPDDDLVIVSHSLGTIVAYDYLADPEHSLGDRRVKLLVTAGSPLGLQLVKARLLGKVPGKPPVAPPTIPKVAEAWVNAYDVLDIVALIHPLAPEFTQAVEGQLVDERTCNPTGPHAIIDYLSDPDIASPISQKMVAT